MGVLIHCTGAMLRCSYAPYIVPPITLSFKDLLIGLMLYVISLTEIQFILKFKQYSAVKQEPEEM